MSEDTLKNAIWKVLIVSFVLLLLPTTSCKESKKNVKNAKAKRKLNPEVINCVNETKKILREVKKSFVREYLTK